MTLPVLLASIAFVSAPFVVLYLAVRVARWAWKGT